MEGKSMNKCERFERCSCAICPLDLGPEIHVRSDLVCPFIKKYIQGGDFPAKYAVAETEGVWRAKIGSGTLNKLLNVKEASEYLGIKVSTLRCWCSRKTIPYVKLGGAVRFNPLKLDEMIKNCSIEPENHDILLGSDSAFITKGGHHEGL